MTVGLTGDLGGEAPELQGLAKKFVVGDSRVLDIDVFRTCVGLVIDV